RSARRLETAAVAYLAQHLLEQGDGSTLVVFFLGESASATAHLFQLGAVRQAPADRRREVLRRIGGYEKTRAGVTSDARNFAVIIHRRNVGASHIQDAIELAGNDVAGQAALKGNKVHVPASQRFTQHLLGLVGQKADVG